MGRLQQSATARSCTVTGFKGWEEVRMRKEGRGEKEGKREMI